MNKNSYISIVITLTFFDSGYTVAHYVTLACNPEHRRHDPMFKTVDSHSIEGLTDSQIKYVKEKMVHYLLKGAEKEIGRGNGWKEIKVRYQESI